MCGRFVRSSSVETYARLFDAEGGFDLDPSYNVAPSQAALIARPSDGRRQLALLHWGLVPAWASDSKIAYSTFNARAETVATKPAFRTAFRRRRCLIAADGFYEWKRMAGERQPYFIGLRDGGPFAFAGLWERWQRGDETMESCTIIVTQANELIAPIHDRMPVILPPERYAAWLDPGLDDPRRLQDCLQPYPASALRVYPVSSRVNNPRNNDAALLRPL
jgi:putative SOS response-associated peptidase YedK